MKKMICIYALICILALLIVLIQFRSNQTAVKNYDIKITKNSPENYILRSENGKLKLYKSDKVVKSYDISPDSLPLTDRDNLRSGIILESYDEVLKIIEDFDG